jgi:hypothetical protein
VQKAIADPPAYIVTAFGERPDRPTRRGAWYRAVRQIESYRYRFGVRDAEHALGDEPKDDLARRAAFRAAHQDLERAREQLSRTREQERDTGRSIG